MAVDVAIVPPAQLSAVATMVPFARQAASGVSASNLRDNSSSPDKGARGLAQYRRSLASFTSSSVGVVFGPNRRIREAGCVARRSGIAARLAYWPTARPAGRRESMVPYSKPGSIRPLAVESGAVFSDVPFPSNDGPTAISATAPQLFCSVTV